MNMRRTFASLIFALLASLATCGATNNYEIYLKLRISARQELAKLTRVVSIDDVQGLIVYAYANDKQLDELSKLGYVYTVLPHPTFPTPPDMAKSAQEMNAWNVYPTYPAYVNMMDQFAALHPDLCQIVNVGTTVNGRSILFAKVSKNVAVEEDEPEVLFSSSMHGDETAGYVLMLRLIDSLLAGYGSDSLITRLVDSSEIWINPLANPDGTYRGGDNSVSGATRFNANNVDLNRNFPDPVDGPHPDGYSWQPETAAMMGIAEGHAAVLSGNFHGGAEVVNYPWDTWARLHVDNDWFVDISRQYADSAQFYGPSHYMDDLNNGITNGYAWYRITGGRQDYMIFWRGSREATIEISGTKLVAAGQLPAFWQYNRVSFLNYLENALYGVRGKVTDAVTGAPLAATLTVDGHDSDLDSSRVLTDPDVGDYHRLIEPGTYTLTFQSPGHYSKTVENVTVASESSIRVDVALDPVTITPDLALTGYRSNPAEPGDSAALIITLRNQGNEAATGVSAVLTMADQYISLIYDSSAFPAIAASGGLGVSLTPYRFVIAASCPSFHSVPFALVVTADGGYVDTLGFDYVVGQIMEDFEAGDFSRLPWQSSGSQPWTITAADAYDGTYAARSGVIVDNQSSILTVSLDVVASGNISFNHRVSSESDWDILTFAIDGAEQGRWSGEGAWSAAAFPVSAGPHIFAWTYAKDGSLSRGSDCAWVDRIIFPSLSPGPSITTTSLPDWTAGYPFAYQLAASGGIGDLSWTDTGGGLSGSGLTLSATGIVSGTVPSSRQLSFIARVGDAPGRTDQWQFSFAINPPLAIETDSLPDGIVGQSYSRPLSVSGGTGGRSWSDKYGDLIGTGLALSADGVLSGSASAASEIGFMALVSDAIGSAAEKHVVVRFRPAYLCGDANGDAMVNVGDAVYVVNYVFKGGATPQPLEAGDANCDHAVNVGDAVYVINYIFRGGPAACCP